MSKPMNVSLQAVSPVDVAAWDAGVSKNAPARIVSEGMTRFNAWYASELARSTDEYEKGDPRFTEGVRAVQDDCSSDVASGAVTALRETTVVSHDVQNHPNTSDGVT
jgi:hypothetical protein